MVKYFLPPLKKGTFSVPFFHNVVLSLSVLPPTSLLRLDLAEMTAGLTEGPLGLTVLVSTALGEGPLGLTVAVSTALGEVLSSLTEVPMISILIVLLVNLLVSSFKLKCWFKEVSLLII